MKISSISTMDNVVQITSVPVNERFNLELNGPNKFTIGIPTPVAKPMIDNVKIISYGTINDFIKNKLVITWVNENPKRYLCLMCKNEGLDVATRIEIWSFTKDLIELNGKILKLNCSIKVNNENIGIEPNQEVIITLTEAGLKKFNNMLKKWV